MIQIEGLEKYATWRVDKHINDVFGRYTVIIGINKTGLNVIANVMEYFSGLGNSIEEALAIAEQKSHQHKAGPKGASVENPL